MFSSSVPRLVRPRIRPIARPEEAGLFEFTTVFGLADREQVVGLPRIGGQRGRRAVGRYEPERRERGGSESAGRALIGRSGAQETARQINKF